MSLADLVLHERTSQLLSKLIHKMPHALILQGESGVGVRTIAQAMAHEIDALSIVIEPKKREKGEPVVNMQEGSVLIDDIRKLYSDTRAKTRKKHVYIIDTGVKGMVPAAQNAFLKLLEEPRAGVYFIIATHRSDLLLPTIKSRAQTVQVLPPSPQQIQAMVQAYGVADPTKVARLNFIGSGRPALVAGLVADEQLYERRVSIMTDAKSLISGDKYGALLLANSYKDKRADATLLAEYAVQLMRIAISHQASQSSVAKIDKLLVVRDNLAVNCNIRLQLAAYIMS